MLLGPKGTGKSSMVIDAAVKQNADGFAMLECHEDPEVVRLRLGIALDFQYNVSMWTGVAVRVARGGATAVWRRRRCVSGAGGRLIAGSSVVYSRRTLSPACFSAKTPGKVEHF